MNRNKKSFNLITLEININNIFIEIKKKNYDIMDDKYFLAKYNTTQIIKINIKIDELFSRIL